MPSSWPPPHPLLCLVTDRHALSNALAQADALAALRRQVAEAVDAGVDIIHIRERDLEAGSLRDLVGECVVRAAGSETRVVVNDRLDVALAASAAGVHLRGDSIAAPRLRAAVPDGFLLGQSVRGGVEASSAAGVDYLLLGTIFPTASKPGSETLIGPRELERVARSVRVPVLAIGGVSEETLPELARTGAAGIAAIRLFFPAASQGQALGQRVARWRRVFDRNRPIS